MRMGREGQTPLPLWLPPEEAGGGTPSPPQDWAVSSPGDWAGEATMGRGGALWGVQTGVVGQACHEQRAVGRQAGVCVGSGSSRGFFKRNACEG